MNAIAKAEKMELASTSNPIAATLQAWGNGFADQLALLLIAIPLWLVVAVVRDLYRTTAWRWDHAGLEEFASIVAITAQWGLSALVLGWATGMLSEVKIRPLAIGWVVTVLIVFAVRAIVRWRARQCSWFWENAIVLGPAEQAERVVRRILRQRGLGINVMACVEPAEVSPRATARATSGDGLRHIGPVPEGLVTWFLAATALVGVCLLLGRRLRHG